jgi:hypothetical protein
MSQDSAVGVPTSCRLDDKGFRFRVPVWARYSLQVVQTSYGAQPASYPMSNGDSFPGVNRKESEAD